MTYETFQDSVVYIHGICEDKEYLHVASFKKSGVGMSGGPLINNNKELLGMIVASDNDVKSKKQIALYYTIETIDKVYNEVQHEITSFLRN